MGGVLSSPTGHQESKTYKISALNNINYNNANRININKCIRGVLSEQEPPLKCVSSTIPTISHNNPNVITFDTGNNVIITDKNGNQHEGVLTDKNGNNRNNGTLTDGNNNGSNREKKNKRNSFIGNINWKNFYPGNKKKIDSNLNRTKNSAIYANENCNLENKNKNVNEKTAEAVIQNFYAANSKRISTAKVNTNRYNNVNNFFINNIHQLPPSNINQLHKYPYYASTTTSNVNVHASNVNTHVSNVSAYADNVNSHDNRFTHNNLNRKHQYHQANNAHYINNTSNNSTNYSTMLAPNMTQAIIWREIDSTQMYVPRKTLMQASNNELHHCLAHHLRRRCFNIPRETFNFTQVIDWWKAVDRNLMNQGWQDVTFVNPANTVFIFMLIKEVMPCEEFVNSQELKVSLMSCLYMSYTYLGNEISYPLKPFLVDPSDRRAFWDRCMLIINKLSKHMLMLNSHPPFFSAYFTELKGECSDYMEYRPQNGTLTKSK